MKRAKEQLNELVGMKNIKDLLFSYDCLESRDASKNGKVKKMTNIIITGNPGTGKTTVAKLIGQLFYELGYLETGHCVSVDRSTLVGKYLGHTVDQTRAAIERALGGVLFIDEAYSLKRSENDYFGQEALDTLCKYMDEYKGQFIVVAAGYPREMEVFLNSNPGFASRFTKVNIDDYTPEEMHKIIDFCATKNKAVFTKEFDEKLSDFCENWMNLSDENWGNASEAVNLVNKLIRKCKNDINHKTIKMEDGAECLLLEEKYLPESMINLLNPVSELRDEAFNRLIDRLNSMPGLAGVKDAVERIRSRVLSGDMKVPGHYVFLGNPGTGKTTVAKLIGQLFYELGYLETGHCVSVDRSTLVGKYLGHTVDQTRAAIERALGGVLFIDEAYSLKQSENDYFGQEALDTLCQYMDEYKGQFIVVAEGYPREMDVFLNSNSEFKSRFDEIFVLEDYTAEELLEIFKLKCKNKKFNIDEVLCQQIKQMFDNMISQKLANWANAQEAYNLEQRIHVMWVKNPIVKFDTNTNEKISFYTVDHIPPEYKKYL